MFESVCESFGILPNGRCITRYTLRNKRGVSLSVLDYGAIVQSWHVPDRNGVLGNIVIGFDTLDAYIRDPYYIGCVVGRVANRIAGGVFECNSQRYGLDRNENGIHHLHGGINGLHRACFSGKIVHASSAIGVCLTYLSVDRESGYPGNVHITVTYWLTHTDRLTMDLFATTDMTTPLSLASHAYFNLSGGEANDITHHWFQCDASQYVETDSENIPTGALLPVTQTPLDFRVPMQLGEQIHKMYDGYDQCLVLRKHLIEVEVDKPMASLWDPKSGRKLSLWTTQPGLQLYTGGHLSCRNVIGDSGIGRFGGVCLETQAFPDAVHHAHFPSVWLPPGKCYEHKTILDITTT